MSNRTLARLVLVAALAFAASPVVFPGFAGFDPGLFPVPQQDPPVQPAGWAFSIWGVIYAWLVAGAGFGLWRRARDGGHDGRHDGGPGRGTARDPAPSRLSNSDAAPGAHPGAFADREWRAMRPPLLASLAVGVFWLPVAGRLPGLATLMILAMLAGAIAAMLRAGARDPWWQRRPVALYAGWLTAASAASAGIWLGGHGWLSAQVAAIACLLAVGVLALSVQARRPREWAYPAGVIWALAGVIAANWSAGNWPVILIATLGIAALAGRIGAAHRPNQAAPTEPPQPDRPC